jgi:hypothetical protein
MLARVIKQNDTANSMTGTVCRGCDSACAMVAYVAFRGGSAFHDVIPGGSAAKSNILFARPAEACGSLGGGLDGFPLPNGYSRHTRCDSRRDSRSNRDHRRGNDARRIPPAAAASQPAHILGPIDSFLTVSSHLHV